MLEPYIKLDDDARCSTAQWLMELVSDSGSSRAGNEKYISRNRLLSVFDLSDGPFGDEFDEDDEDEEEEAASLCPLEDEGDIKKSKCRMKDENECRRALLLSARDSIMTDEVASIVVVSKGKRSKMRVDRPQIL